MIIASSKGGTKTQNIINMTWMFHPQIMGTVNPGIPLALELHPMPNIEFTREEIFANLRSFAMFGLNYAEDICKDYQIFRPIKQELHVEGGDAVMTFMTEIMTYCVTDPKIADTMGLRNWRNRYKVNDHEASSNHSVVSM